MWVGKLFKRIKLKSKKNSYIGEKYKSFFIVVVLSLDHG